MSRIALLAGKITKWIIDTFNLGAGATWPGEIALKMDENFVKNSLISRKVQESKIILVAGTNGKTTTAKLIKDVLEASGKKVVHNLSGANLLNGVASVLVENIKADYYVFEVDEASLPKIIEQTNPDFIILLNLFRDQLDRYGEVDTVAHKWAKSLVTGTLIICADDPLLVQVAKETSLKTIYFGLENKKFYLSKVQHATDSLYCPKCGARLDYRGYYFSHLGDWECPKCDFDHPNNNFSAGDFPVSLDGVYNRYNFLAAGAVLTSLKVPKSLISLKFKEFKPAFGRQEEINGVKILLSKNPTGFNESLRTAIASGGSMLLVLNDRIPDGKDVSWIWDVDFEQLKKYEYQIFIWGDRKEDLAVRLKYAGVNAKIEKNYNVRWVLCTYSAMLEVRKDLTGKKIL